MVNKPSVFELLKVYCSGIRMRPCKYSNFQPHDYPVGKKIECTSVSFTMLQGKKSDPVSARKQFNDLNQRNGKPTPEF